MTTKHGLLLHEYEAIGYACGMSEDLSAGADEACDLVCSYIEALGISRDVTSKHPAKWRVIAGLMDRRYQGAILKWWWIDRKRGAKPPFGLGTAEPLAEITP